MGVFLAMGFVVAGRKKIFHLSAFSAEPCALCVLLLRY